MSVKTTVLFCSVILHLSVYSIIAQQLANKKCSEYLNSSRVATRTALGIVGGALSRNNEFPHMAALGYGPKRNMQWLCGGTLISENFILTASHCTNHQELGSVRAARMGVENLRDNRRAIDIEISRIIQHPSYKSPSQYNDIALLKMKSPVKFSKFISPACLNTAFDIKTKTDRLTAAGWGSLTFGGNSSDNLMKVDLILYPHKQCRRHYANVSRRKLAKGIDNSIQICAGGTGNKEKDTCQGDSGGPLVMKTGTLYTVVGVTAFGKACGIANVPGVYTRVSSYVPWIEKNVWSK